MNGYNLSLDKRTQQATARVRVIVQNADGGVRSIFAKAENGAWEDITKAGYLTVAENTLVSVRAKDNAGKTAAASRRIVCFGERLQCQQLKAHYTG